jgi:coenzyme F420 hydrogenase subunit beta
LEKYLSQGASMLSPKQRVEQIVEHGLCIGCGLCQSVAGEDKIQVLKGNTGFLVPIFSEVF